MVGHRTEAIYRRYAIKDYAMLKEEALKLAKLHAPETGFSKVRQWFGSEVAIDASKGVEFLVVFLESRGGETADAVDSKSTVGNHMRVQVPPSAPK